jgi:hypothetical protein
MIENGLTSYVEASLLHKCVPVTHGALQAKKYTITAWQYLLEEVEV